MRGNRTQCRLVKRCVLFLIAITLLPLALVYFVVNDQLYHIKALDLVTGGNSGSNSTLLQSGDDLHRAALRPLSAIEMEMIEIRMRQRSERLAEKCTEFGLDALGNDSLHKPNPWEFLVNRQHHLIWCNVFKAASTSWMYNFNILAGYSPSFLRKTNMVPLTLARRKYPRVTMRQLELAMNDSITFLIVRHPFERLLSAYRDKMVFALPHSLHDKLGARIVRKYRTVKKGWKQPKWPTFGEFVSYLLEEDHRKASLDMHWTSITKFCTPCQIKFDIIAKFETLDEDQRYIIHKTNLGHIISPQWKNSGKGQNTQILIAKFFTQLTRDQIEGLYRMYRYDFELFDYSYEMFANMVTEPPTMELGRN